MPKKLISNRQVKIYQKTITNLRESLGREVKVYVGEVDQSFNWDPVNNEPLDPTEPLVYADVIYTIEKATVRWLDKTADYEFLPAGRLIDADVVIKCSLSQVLMSGSNVNNETIFDYARKIEVDGQIVKLKAPPVKTGLRDLFNCIVYCTRVDEE